MPLELPPNRDLTTPWELGFNDRGLGHGDYGLLRQDGSLILGGLDPDLAKHLLEVHNASPLVHEDGLTLDELRGKVLKGCAELKTLLGKRHVNTEAEEDRKTRDGWEVHRVQETTPEETNPATLRNRLTWLENSITEYKP